MQFKDFFLISAAFFMGLFGLALAGYSLVCGQLAQATAGLLFIAFAGCLAMCADIEDC